MPQYMEYWGTGILGPMSLLQYLVLLEKATSHTLALETEWSWACEIPRGLARWSYGTLSEYVFPTWQKWRQSNNKCWIYKCAHKCTNQRIYISDRTHSTPSVLQTCVSPNLFPEVESSVEIGTYQRGSYFGVIFSHATFPWPAGAK